MKRGLKVVRPFLSQVSDELVYPLEHFAHLALFDNHFGMIVDGAVRIEIQQCFVVVCQCVAGAAVSANSNNWNLEKKPSIFLFNMKVGLFHFEKSMKASIMNNKFQNDDK